MRSSELLRKKSGGKAKNSFIKKNYTFLFFLKKYSNHTEEKWVSSQARNNNKKRSESKAVSEVMMLKFDFNQFAIL